MSSTSSTTSRPDTAVAQHKGVETYLEKGGMHSCEQKVFAVTNWAKHAVCISLHGGLNAVVCSKI